MSPTTPHDAQAASRLTSRTTGSTRTLSAASPGEAVDHTPEGLADDPATPTVSRPIATDRSVDDDPLGRLIDDARRDPATDEPVRRWLARLAQAGRGKRGRRKAR